MNIGMIRRLMGRTYAIFALLLLLPLITALIYQEENQAIFSWLATIGLCLLLYLILARTPIRNDKLYAREGLVICALLWISLSLIGGLPLFWSGAYPSLADSFFEIASGLTTTGSTVCPDVEALPHSILIWRSFTHLIGGMGVLVFALAILPSAANSRQLAKAEMPGPSFDKLTAKMADTARILYKMYCVMTAVLVVLLLLGGMPLFDSLCHAFGTAGTGGFGIYNDSIGHYDSSYLHVVLSLGMLVFSVNFSLYYLIRQKKLKEALTDEELRCFLWIVLIAIVLIALPLAKNYDSIWLLLRDVLFTVSSVISTTGYATVDFGQWPLFTHIVLLALMFIGGCAGSTAGGFKVSRVVVTAKESRTEMLRTIQPSRVKIVKFNGHQVSEENKHKLFGYLAVYVLIFAALLLFVSLEAPDFETAFSSVACTFNNVGPGFGAVGPSGNFAFYSRPLKVLLGLGMIAGRLEIWPVLVLFSRQAWSRY